MTHHSLPPQCIEAENRLLDLLEKDSGLVGMALILDAEDFYRDANRERFKEIISNTPYEITYLCQKIKLASDKRREAQDYMGAIQEIYERFGISSPGTDK